jgi:4-diphosphocytidyl-2-C-methyl-D-erythritol kinase
MICFPNAKINLGLRITEKRSDGFHNIETVFYPVAWNEALEIVENKKSELEFNLHLSGLPINGNTTDNLLFKAYHLIKAKVSIPHIDVYLHKTLPMGAGLGGGSADAAFFINLINTQFNLGLSKEIKLEIAKQLGSDCAFFIENTPVLATEKGDVFSNYKN